MSRSQNQVHYWAKTTTDNQPGISVLAHNQNVGWSAKICAHAYPHILTLLGLTADTVATLAALHDIGKISQGFQCKCPAWVEQQGLTKEAKRWHHANCTSDHALISQYTVSNLLNAQNLSIWWALAIGAHHGRLKRMEELGLPHKPGMRDDEWESSRQACAGELIDTFGPLPNTPIDPDSPALWWVAGLITVADWIGSNEEIFSSQRDVPSAIERQEQARIAVEQLGLAPPDIQQGLSFQDLFQLDGIRPSTPNQLQQAAYETIKEPGIYVIEAPMGMGKTEAALWVTYRLMCEGKASGLYFALPTQITSNRIHLRVEDFVRRMTASSTSRVHLVHANSWLREDLIQPTFTEVTRLNGTVETDSDNARVGRDWFASSKRAIMAPFGVGTVDQALLGIVAVKHFFVRRFALAGKVVVIDEVHSYDLYTGTLIRILCDTLCDLGCTVILLSATLTAQQRNALLRQPNETAFPQNEAYPLISGKSATTGTLSPRSVPPPVGRSIALRFIVEPDAFDDAWATANAGASVLWICNTIGNAQAVYRHFRQRDSTNAIELDLLHSRFPFFQRDIIENYWMTRLGKTNNVRKGCILVATQVVEQSVDLDADLLVTVLAPTDMLLQRMGRLWRHARSARPVTRAETWIIVPDASLDALQTMTADAIRNALKPSSKVYNPYVLLRTLEEWQRYEHVTIPDNIRTLLENTYCAHDHDPPAWQDLDCRRAGETFTLRTFAETQANIWQAALNDIEGKACTRLDERGTIPIILCQQWDGTTAILLQGDRIHPAEAQYRLKTAQAIHRNLVKVPDWVVTVTEKPAERYVYEPHAIAEVGANGLLKIAGVEPGFQLRYTPELGLLIESQATEDTKDHDESCF